MRNFIKNLAIHTSVYVPCWCQSIYHPLSRGSKGNVPGDDFDETGS